MGAIFDVAELTNRAGELRDAYLESMSDQYDPQCPECQETANGILSYYDNFLDTPDPAGFKPYTDGLLIAMKKIAPESFETHTDEGKTDVDEGAHIDGVSTTADWLRTWSGTAAATFKATYAAHFDSSAWLQFQALARLRHCINAEAAVWETMRSDLDDLSSRAIEEMKHVNDCTHDDWMTALAVAGAVVGVAAAIPTGGMSLTATAAIAGAGITVVSTGMDLAGPAGTPDKAGDPIDNDSENDVLEGLNNRLQKIRTHVYEQEKKINDSLSDLCDSIDGSKYYLLDMPALGSIHKGGVKNDRNMGEPA